MHPAFDAVLLALCAMPVMMGFGIFPVSHTPYWLFFLFFAALSGNIVYSFICVKDPLFEKRKTVITLIIVLGLLVGCLTSAIAERGRLARGLNHHTHDVVLQLEAAIRYLNAGKNPYKETYFGTPLENWYFEEDGKTATNPALYHFVMPPGYLISAYPFYGLSKLYPGYFDGRMPMLFFTVGLLLILPLCFRSHPIKRLAIIVVGLNPATVGFLIEGRSDMAVLFPLVASVLLLLKKRYLWGVLMFALAMLVKQSVWFSFPFFVAYLWSLERGGIKGRLLFQLAAFIGFFAVIAGPFLLWDWDALVRSTILYLSGNTEHAYPIAGYGLGMLLTQWGVIKSIHDAYPFTLWQVMLGIPLYIFGIKKLLSHPKPSVFFLFYAATLTVIWYVSRYFNNNHIGYIITIAALGMLFDWDEHQSYE